MKKEDYLNQLNSHLPHLSPSVHDEVMKHFTDYFNQAEPDKLDQIMQELGSPADLAKEITLSMDTVDKKANIGWTNWDIDSNIPPSKTKAWNKQVLAAVTSITFQLLNLNIHIQTDNIQQAELSYFDEGNLSVSQTPDGALTLIEQPLGRDEHYSSLTLFQLGDMLAKRRTITLVLPKEAQIQTLTGDSKNGSVSLHKLPCASIILNTYNGNIDLQHIDNARADILSKNGSVRISDCQLDNSRIETKNARLDCHDCQLSKSQVINKHGKLTVEGGSLQESLLQNKNGDVLVKGSRLSTRINFVNKIGALDIRLTADNLAHSQVQTRSKNDVVTISRQVGTAFPNQALISITNKYGPISLK